MTKTTDGSVDNRTKSGYLPSLDGWRAISILLVLLAHDYDIKSLHYTHMLGHLGVNIFFAISGVLMVWRIQKDEQAAGFFDVRGFYLRRFFRIQPAMLLYLAVVAVLMKTHVLHDQWRFWLGALLSFRNFQFHFAMFYQEMGHSWFTGQFWTLSVEEHFYVLLSSFFLLVKRRRTLVMGTLLVILLVGQRWATKHGFYSANVSGFRTYWVLQFLIFPALLSLIIQTTEGMRLALRFCRPWAVFLTSALILAAATSRHLGQNTLPTVLVGTAINDLPYILGFWVVATMIHPHSWSTRLLELSALKYVGRLSYSIYLWQQLFFWSESPQSIITWHPLLWASREPLHYVVVLGFAALSYHFVEKPMIRLGHRIAAPATPGHQDLQVDSAASAQMMLT